ncbi:MAG: PKD domain-containing protein, partial [Bacteroidota bacterium]
MKKILLILLLSLCFSEANASHIMGGQITYSYIGNNKYLFTLKGYRDCRGVLWHIPAVLYIEPAIGWFNFIQLDSISKFEITPVCDTQHTACNDSTSLYYGVQEYIFSDTLTIEPPFSPDGYTISFKDCARNWAITTVDLSRGGCFYISTKIYPQLARGNSSPQFLNPPTLYVCANQTVTYSHGAYDADGDSLVYSLVPCLYLEDSSVAYLPPFSATNPISSTPPAVLDASSGDFTFTPTQANQVGILAVRVEEFRNGIKIGEVVRDLQITVIDCNNNIPFFTEPTYSSITVYAGNQYCVDFTAIDSDNDTAKNLLSMSINTSIDSSTFNWNNPLPSYEAITGTFCLNTTCAQVRSQPYIVNVIVRDNACPIYGSNVKTLLIYVKDSVDFSFTSPVCENQPVVFSSTNRCAETILWDFDDGSAFATGTEVQHTFSNKGNYAVQMISISGSGIADTVKKNIIVYSSPRAKFTTNPDDVEPNQVIQFNYTGNILPGQQYFWYFGDGDSSALQNPTHTYINGTDSVIVTLIVVNASSCADTMVKVYSFITMANFETEFPLCENTPVVFTNLSQHADTFRWDFGDSSAISNEENPTHLYTGSGVFTVELIASNISQSDTIYKAITIGTVPSASFFTVPLEFKQKVPITFFNTSISDSDALFYWNFGDNFASDNENPVHTYNTSKDSVEVIFIVTSTSFCADTVRKYFLFAPIANFKLDTEICQYNSVQFINRSLNASSYIWNFNDGSPVSTSENPVHIFFASGLFQITLIAMGNGTPDTVEQFIKVVAKPIAAFTFDSAATCSNNPIQFTNTSLNAISYFWDFGDGISSTYRNPVHLYSSLGTYTVRMLAINTLCADTAEQTLAISVAPIPMFTVARQKVCVGEKINFINSSTSAISYLWNFGDGDSSTLTHPEHTFDSTGFFTVTLYANNGYCVRSFDIGIMVYGIPVADFIATPSDFLPNIPVTFTNLSTTGNDISYFWDFGDRSKSTEFSPVHTYRKNFSEITVTLIVTNHIGCADTIKKNYGFPLIANFTFNTPICLKDKAYFVNTSTNAKKYLWNFGDGSTSASKNPSHKYAAKGMYTVTLIASNNFSSDTIANSIEVIANPKAAFSASETKPCEGAQVKFFNTSLNATQYFWDFMDSSPVSTDSSPTHIFNEAGTYKVKLVVKNDICTDSITKQIKVYVSPQALFQIVDSVICINEPLQ